MFLKAFRVKSNTAIRGSDRRKLRSDVSSNFPSLSQDEISELIPNKEEISVMRVMTHSGQNITVFCLSGEPIFFEVEKRVIPTVYTLWKFPDLLLSFTTWPPVLEKLKGGADLMLPGVVVPTEGVSALGRFEKGAICCVCLNGNRAPVAVGVTIVSSRDLLEDGMRGKGVMIYHVYQDLLWAHGSKRPLPQLTVLDDEVKTDEVKNSLQELSFDDAEGTEHNKSRGDAYIDGSTDTEGGFIGDDVENNEANASNVAGDENEQTLSEEASYLDVEEEATDTPNSLLDNMDDLLEYCFFCALLRMKKVELPLLTSTFFRTYLLPSCPAGKSLDIKKSSFKKLSKFLQCMQDRRLIIVQEASKGVDQITTIVWENPELKNFKAKRPVLESATEVPSLPASAGTQREPPSIEELFSVSAAMLPIFSEFGYSKSTVMSPSDVRTVVTNYVKSHELVSTENKRMVVLDPTLTRILLNKNEDIAFLPWDQLFERVSSKMNKCHQITFPGQDPLVRKGKIESIEIKVEQRMGNKKVTLIRNLELYGINPQEFAHNIQLKAACSTSVSQLPGKNISPGMQVLIQGNQVAIVAKFLLDEYKIPKKYISGLEHLKSGKKKK